jgi:hypothetical protein
MRSSQSSGAVNRSSSPARAGRGLQREAHLTSAALNSAPANQGRPASSASMKASWAVRLGCDEAARHLVGDAPHDRLDEERHLGALRTLSKTSFISSGGIALPSAKCSQ